jgi:hypothetical protein
MKPALLALLSVAGVCLQPPAASPATVQRFALVAGANRGGGDRPLLQYAVSDAERFARVLADLGGVAPAQAIVLRQPQVRELEDAIDALRARVAAASRAPGGRTEVIFYYSGHADEKGLLLGDDRYSYRSLRDRLDEVPADVRIAVLDACASGAITRLKGGRLRQPFLVDESADMRGHAFLTSSTESEAAQESDRLRGSYFTHFLVSGLRGAADLSGEGKVTLNEAYQFAFNETLGRTVDTKGGAQHPSYDINLSGTGDVVMTDLRQTTATLVLGQALDGRFFVRNARQELVVELYKPYGRTVELGLEPGAYEVRLERESAAMLARPRIAEGARVVLEPDQFGLASPEPTRARGGEERPRFGLTGRNRLDVRLGMWRLGGSGDFRVAEGGDTVNAVGGLQYTRFLSPSLAVTIAANGIEGGGGTTVGPDGVFDGGYGVAAIQLGVRWNPLPGNLEEQPMKPALVVSVGPVIGGTGGTEVYVNGGSVFNGGRSEVTIGAFLGGGVDFHLGRNFSMGFTTGYNWVGDFEFPIAGRSNYSGFELSLNFGWVFGKGTPPRP